MILWTWVSLGLVLLLPGAAWLAWMPLHNRGFAHSLAAVFGISLAVTALGALATFLTGVYLSSAGLIIIEVILAGVALTGWLRRRWVWSFSWEWVVTIVLAGSVIAWRLYQASSLALPAWVDSVNHVLIVQAILSRGGITGDLSPYLPVPFYYHFGFHSVAAVYAFLGALSADRAVLIIGQVLSAGVGLAVYRLGAVIWQDSRRGLAAALLVSFFSTMPAYYLTWGRYTFLVGLTLMALAMAEVVEILQRGDRQPADPVWQTAVRLGLFTAGVLLSHYLTALLLALFMVLAGVYLAWRDLFTKKINIKIWIPLLAGSLGGALLALPWILRVIHFSSSSIALDVTLPAQLGGKGFSTDYANYLWYLAGPQHNHWLQILSGLGVLFVLINWKSRPAPEAAIFAVWSVLMALGCLPVGLNLAPFQPHHLVMVIFFPVVLLGGHLLVSAGDALAKTSRRAWLGHIATALAVGLLCIWGIRETRSILNPVTILADQADRQALDWINIHIPAEARFFINATPWQGSVFRGVDGGYWILPYTGRQTILPPLSYVYGTKKFFGQINEWVTKASQLKTCNADFMQLVTDANLSYVYIRQGVGSLQPEGLKDCSRLEVVYQQQGVFIYHINP